MAESGGKSPLVWCVAGDAHALKALAAQISRHATAPGEIAEFRDAGLALRRARGTAPGETAPAIVFVRQDIAQTSGCELIAALHEIPSFRNTRKVLIGSPPADALRTAVNSGALDWILPEAPSSGEIAQALNNAMGKDREKGEIPENAEVFHADFALDDTPGRFLLDDLHSDDDLRDSMIREFDRILERPPRRHFSPGQILLEEGRHVDGVLVVESGQVQLVHMAKGREIILHMRSTGNLLGLMALIGDGKATFTCRAASDGAVIPVRQDDLSRALLASPSLASTFMTVLIRSLAIRNRHSSELQVEVETLNIALASERDSLAHAVTQLEMAQERVAESARMATLGQLSAGIAHELNNPIAAIQRSADFVREDMLSTLERVAGGGELKRAMQSAIETPPLSSSKIRQCRAELKARLGDGELARRLTAAGIMTIEDYDARFGGKSREEREEILAKTERYYQMGAALRNIANCAQRVTSLVQSLRSYARGGESPVADVDLHQCLEDTLLLFGHAMREIDVERDYGEIPPVECMVGRINQVWTNLFSNALEAMENKGKILIQTGLANPDRVYVKITDSGPGIPFENLEKIFERDFTTKEGRVAYGLGMGLPICREILKRHRGSISIDSMPGRTCATVEIPVRFPTHDAGAGHI